MMTAKELLAILVFMRLVVAGIFAAGAVWLAFNEKEGWGWCIFAGIVLGSITASSDRS